MRSTHAVQLEDVRAHGVDERAIVRHQQRRRLRHRLQAILQPLHALHRQMVRGLVQDEQVRLLDERRRERHALALPAAQLAHLSLQKLRTSELLQRGSRLRLRVPRAQRVHALQRVRHRRLVHVASLSARHDQVVLAEEFHEGSIAGVDRLEDVEFGVEGGFLFEKSDGDALADPELAVLAADVLPGEDGEEGGLAAAVGTDDGDALAGAEGEVDVHELVPLAVVGLAEALADDDGLLAGGVERL